jgi:hypothetical protein
MRAVLVIFALALLLVDTNAKKDVNARALGKTQSVNARPNPISIHVNATETDKLHPSTRGPKPVKPVEPIISTDKSGEDEKPHGTAVSTTKKPKKPVGGPKKGVSGRTVRPRRSSRRTRRPTRVTFRPTAATTVAHPIEEPLAIGNGVHTTTASTHLEGVETPKETQPEEGKDRKDGKKTGGKKGGKAGCSALYKRVGNGLDIDVNVVDDGTDANGCGNGRVPKKTASKKQPRKSS